jgi:poly(A) polymerase
MKTFGVGPCAEIGIIKSQMKESILEGTIPNEYEAAYSEMMRIGKELGLVEKLV